MSCDTVLTTTGGRVDITTTLQGELTAIANIGIILSRVGTGDIAGQAAIFTPTSHAVTTSISIDAGGGWRLLPPDTVYGRNVQQHR